MWKLGLRLRNSLSENTSIGFSLQCISNTLPAQHPPSGNIALFSEEGGKQVHFFFFEYVLCRVQMRDSATLGKAAIGPGRGLGITGGICDTFLFVLFSLAVQYLTQNYLYVLLNFLFYHKNTIPMQDLLKVTEQIPAPLPSRDTAHYLD
jgi:hypothetical protein